MLEKEYFTKDGIIETLKKAEDYSVDSFDDLFNSMFNNNYYIIGTYKASKALETYKNDETLDGYETALDGVLGAIELVKQYESDQFGEVSTLLDNPEELANMIEYIRGESLFGETLNKAGLDFDSETTKENVKKFIAATKEL